MLFKLTRSVAWIGHVSNRMTRQVNMNWDDDYERVMQNIKEKFSSDPVLEWPKFEASIILDINVSDIDVVYVLSRVIDGGEKGNCICL